MNQIHIRVRGSKRVGSSPNKMMEGELESDYGKVGRRLPTCVCAHPTATRRLGEKSSNAEENVEGIMIINGQKGKTRFWS